MHNCVMSGLSVASTVLVLFYHHRNKNIGIKYPDRTPDVHSTRLYRVKRPEKENNNRHNGLSRNGVQPSTERLLADYMAIATIVERIVNIVTTRNIVLSKLSANVLLRVLH
jgi:hypothetical protein